MYEMILFYKAFNILQNIWTGIIKLVKYLISLKMTSKD